MNTKTGKLILFLLAGAALLLLPILLQSTGSNSWVRILDIALLYVLLALGLNIVVGYAGLLDLGYIAFFAVGAYVFALLGSPHLTDTFPAIKAMFPEGIHYSIWIVMIVRPRSSCAATTWPSSRWALARSSASSCSTWTVR